jgi:hypothetical protein
MEFAKGAVVQVSRAQAIMIGRVLTDTAVTRHVSRSRKHPLNFLDAHDHLSASCFTFTLLIPPYCL